MAAKRPLCRICAITVEEAHRHFKKIYKFITKLLIKNE
jgi:hypothetical protein